MGLTIAYSIKASAKWLPAEIRAKLEEARQYAKTLPVVSVSELVEFRGKEADYQHIRESGREKEDEFFWTKIQAQRHLQNPWEPGSLGRQAPSHMLVFTVDPAEGCEPMNVGICSYPPHVWKTDKDSHEPKAWSLALDKENAYPDSLKIMRAFMRRWRLKKLVASKTRPWRRFGETEKPAYLAPGGNAEASIRTGRRLSHRKGYAGSFGLVVIGDRMKGDLCFKFNGSAEEAEKTFALKEFRADLNRMAVGEDHITPAAKRIWGSFVKTQYANDPRSGGWESFVKAHLSVLSILEYMQGLGFGVEVRDEGEFWEKRDLGALAKVLGNYDAMLAGAVGAMKDAAGAAGMDVESPMFGRPDFEHLEAKGQEQGTMGEILKRLLSPRKRRNPPG